MTCYNRLMTINVGTKNPAKIEAVQEIIQDYDFLKDAKVVSVEVDSGISAQPLTLEETIRGAMNRAKNAFRDCDYSFGLESGLFPVPYTKSGYMDTGVCAIYDGRQYHLGLSAPYEYPKKVTQLVVEQGMNISQASRTVGLTEHEYIGHAEGTVGIITKGRVTRKDYTKQAILTALIHLENPDLY